MPLAPGSGDERWLEAVARLAERAAAEAAEAQLRVPTVLVQEGGCDLATLGPLVREVLEGVEEGLGAAW